ncbi:MAG: tetratricopeptide repeat-containing sensor histidine kinase [Flavobacteriaceae bacterium]|nr:tetratricopeptide repeat-containing sensor histidine kinase [Flavobacteriaceae bacterium]
MFRKIAVLIFFLSPFFLLAQKSKKLSPFFKAIELKSNDLTFEKGLEMARHFFLQKQWDSTLIYAAKYIDADNLNRRENDYSHFFKAYSLNRKKLFKQAEKEFNKVSKEFDFYKKIYIYKGGISLEQRRFENAIFNFKKALQNIEKSALIGVMISTVENNIGLCYLHLEEFDQADEYLSKSIKSVELTGDTIKLIGSYGNLATMYYDQEIDEKAIPYFKKAYQLAEKVQDYELKQNTALNMAIVEENRKNFAKALVYRKEYEKWQKLLNDQDRIYETAQLEKKIAVDEKQKQVRVLQAENKVKEAQNKVFLYSGIFLLFLLGILFSSFKGKVKRNKIITEQKEDLDVLNATKDKLFSIVSHDLRSSVNAIKTSNKKLLNKLEKGSPEGLKETVQQNGAIVNGAYGLLDNLLHWALLQTKQSYFEVTQQRLFVIVEHVVYNYKPLMEEKNISFENQVLKTDIVYVDQESLKIILRNLVDNAIKFSNAEGTIKIYTRNEGEQSCDLIVEDNGLGIDQETQKELLRNTNLLSKKKNEDILGTGLGLHLVKSMIQKNDGKFSIESELGKGTKMIISLPKNNSNG